MTSDNDSDLPELVEIEPIEEGEASRADTSTDDPSESDETGAGPADLPDIVSQPRKPETTDGLGGNSESEPDQPGADEIVADVVARRLEGTYEIVEKIGQGGMGTVYAAIQHPLERKVAIKLVKPENRAEGSELYFKREVQAIHTLRHPNIINIVDFGADANGVLYLVTEYLPGRTLREVINQDYPLEPARICNIATQMLSALEEAHSEGIVHCDLKPANIMLEPDGEGGDFVKVLDFGIAEVKSAHQEVGPHTQEGDLVGTFDYMSPEQIMREDVDGRADVWSVGVLLYEMLTKRRIFHADDGAGIIGRVMRLDIPEPAELADGVPLELSDLVMDALQRDLEDRIPSATEMRSRLIAIQEALEGDGASASDGSEDENGPGPASTDRPSSEQRAEPLESTDVEVTESELEELDATDIASLEVAGKGETSESAAADPAGDEADDSEADHDGAARPLGPGDQGKGLSEVTDIPASLGDEATVPPEQLEDVSSAEMDSTSTAADSVSSSDAPPNDELSTELDDSFEDTLADEIASVFEEASIEEELFEESGADDGAETGGDTSSRLPEPSSLPDVDDASQTSETTERDSTGETRYDPDESSFPAEEPSAPTSLDPNSVVEATRRETDSTADLPSGWAFREAYVSRPSIEKKLLRGATSVRERGGRGLHVVGEPGSGRTVLLEGMVDELEQRGWAVSKARGDGPSGAGLMPVLRWIVDLASLYSDAEEFLRRSLSSLGLEAGLEAAVDFYADPAVRRTDLESLPWETPTDFRHVTTRLLHRVLRFTGREKPIVLALDNFDSSDVMLTSCLETFVDAIDRHPVCVLAAGLPLVSSDRFESWPRWHVFELGELSDQQARQCVECQLDTSPDADVVENIATYARRRPGHLSEWLRWVAWTATPSLTPEDVPSDRREMLRSTLDQLPPSFAEGIGFLSVLGRHAPVDHLDEIVPPDLGGGDLLDRALDAELADTWRDHAGRKRLELGSELLEEVAYEWLAEGRRRHHHEQLVKFHEGRGETSAMIDPEERAVRLAFHYRGLDRRLDAASAWFRAGELRFERCNYTGAIRMWEEAIALFEAIDDVPGHHPDRVRTLLRLIESHRELEEFERAADLAQRLPALSTLPSSLLTDALLEIGRTRLESGDLDRSFEVFRRLHAEAPERNEHDKHLRAMVGLADIYEERGDLRRSAKLLMRAGRRVDELEAVSLGELNWTLHNRLGALLLTHGRMERAHNAFQDALDRAKTVRDRRGFIRIYSNLGALALKQGDPELARGHFEQARRIARTVGDMLNQARIAINVGVAAMRDGDLDRAKASFGEAKEIASEIGWEEGLNRLKPRIEELKQHMW